MNTFLPQTYLIALIALLVIVSFVVGRQLLRVRRDEANFIKLEKSGASTSKQASDLYELASVQLKKRLYPQAISTLKNALKRLEGEPSEAKALIENALGFALAAQEEFESAVIHYKIAIKTKPEYPVAINNLAFAKEKLLQIEEAKKLYKDVLIMDPKNKTATKQLKKIESSSEKESPKRSDTKGF